MIKYMWLSFKMQFRIPIAIFFALIFPLLMMVIMISSYGNFSIGGGYHFIDKYFLISTGIGLVPIFIISFPIWIAESIQNNSYRRLSYLGVDIKKMVISDIFSYLFLTVINVLLNIIVAFILFHLKLPSSIYLLSYFAHVLYCAVAMLLTGTLIAFLIRSTKIILPFGMICLFLIYMFCGVFINFNQLPANIKSVGDFIPVKYLMNDFFLIWSKQKYLITSFLKFNTLFSLIISLLMIILYKNRSRRKRI
ncbi:ABC transporter permease [Sporolactobacillus sp. THM7-4]|nr:ABC transporter permease [Sporolactobacillus sp. THM7-4]